MNMPIPALALFALVAVFAAVFLAYALFRIDKELDVIQRLLSVFNVALDHRVGGNVLAGLFVLLIDKLFNSVTAIAVAIVVSVAVFGRRR
ncbi:hypothetical protein [Alcanivorax sp.]|uniref:hypothetical protein n=1 Tax=Alcanivorax sp. TaxID=1872427 RepID=UPI00258C7838|nr:hypothetical protein [Alcanivorax sp.]